MRLGDRPLAGKTVLLTRARGENEPLRHHLEDLGASVVELPAIAIVPPDDPEPLKTALRNLDRYDWICFTSRNAVRAVGEMTERMGVTLPSSLRIGAVGMATMRELETRGIRVDCLPEPSTGAALAEAMLPAGAAGRRVLLPQGDLARPEVRDGLIAGNAMVDTVVAYRTVHPPADEDVVDALRSGRVDIVVLASPSAFSSLMDMLSDNRVLATLRLACIGPTTASAVAQAGFTPGAVAPHPTVDGLVQAVCACSLEIPS